jgi:5S rRNA maturation endonuclease (ribonuclease M5)
MSIPRTSTRGQSALSTSNGQPRQRFSRRATCPVCGGCEDDPRGAAKRCFGFLSGQWIHCTREDHSPNCKFHASSQTYSHRLTGKCPCGTEHNPAPAKPEIDHVYKYRDANGGVVHETVRYRNPKKFSQRRPVGNGKYEWSLKGIETVLYNLPAILTADRDQPVWIVEGEKDVDKLGTLNWLATCNPMGAGKWKDHYSEALRGRHCIIVPDNDQKGRDHTQQVAQSLHGKAASVKIVDLVKLMPDLPEKGDASDFLARGGTVDDLEELAHKTAEWKPSAEQEDRPDAVSTSSQTGYANFQARIVREIVRHEAGETTRHVEVEATHDDGTVATATVAAEDFESMGWVLPQLGMKFAIRTGRGMKDRFQHSIRVNSYREPVELREVFTSLGWNTVGGKDVYLHAGGGIGCNGTANVSVDVCSELALYRLPPPESSHLKEGTERVLAILDNLGQDAEMVASIIISLPYRALLGPSRTIPHFSGTTGTLKTSSACLSARFFAPELEYCDSMPLSWSSTAAGLERLRHIAKDSLVVIDNLIADGEQAARDLWKADWVFNSQGDLIGKGRMRADGSPAPRLDPRGCIISTGECDPRRKSSTGRSIIIEFKPGLINLDGLKRCHDDARSGWYAVTISCYAEHLAVSGRLAAQRLELRRLAQEHQAIAMENYPGCHPRHAEAVAEWTAGWQLFLWFAVEQNALTKQKAGFYLNRVRDRLFATLSTQAEIQDEADPGEIFLELLRSLLGSKRAVLAGMDGMAPDAEIAPACGWQRMEVTRHGGKTVPDWDQAPGAARIGWVDDHTVYLDPNISHAAVERIARELGQVVGSKRQVCARLAETGRIKTDVQAEGKRRRFTRRVTMEKQRREVLCVPREELFLGSDNHRNRNSG